MPPPPAGKRVSDDFLVCKDWHERRFSAGVGEPSTGPACGSGLRRVPPPGAPPRGTSSPPDSLDDESSRKGAGWPTLKNLDILSMAPRQMLLVALMPRVVLFPAESVVAVIVFFFFFFLLLVFFLLLLLMLSVGGGGAGGGVLCVRLCAGEIGTVVGGGRKIFCRTRIVESAAYLLRWSWHRLAGWKRGKTRWKTLPDTSHLCDLHFRALPWSSHQAE